MSDPYRPREHDHLVEPMFGGLGVDPDSSQQDARLQQPLEFPSGFVRSWRRLWRALVRLVRPSRPESGR